MPPADPAKPASTRLRGATIAIALLGVLGVLFVVAPKYLWGGLHMSLDKPTLSGAQPYGPFGTFRLEHRPFGFDSPGTGGACLIADIAALLPASNAHKKNGEIHEGTCTTPEQCNLKGSPPPPGVWEGYCVPDGPNQPGRCWYRPADNDPTKGRLCHTSGHNGGRWPVGVDQKVPYLPGFDLKAFYENHTNGRPARWRLSGRLFGTQSGVVQRNFGHRACLSVDKNKKC